MCYTAAETVGAAVAAAAGSVEEAGDWC